MRSRLPIVVEADGRKFRLVEVGGQVVAHATVCPHRGGPLEDIPVQDGYLTCPWHGYRFDVHSGKNADGRAYHLEAAPFVCVDPDTLEAFLVWSQER